MKLIKVVKEIHHICQGNPPYMSSKPIIYVMETLHKCQGNLSDMSRRPI